MRIRDSILKSFGALFLAVLMGAAPEPYDLVIRNGRVVDGTGNPWFRADVGVRGDRIVELGRIPADAPTRATIDAHDHIVAPGFIDMHSHSDRTLFEDGLAQSKIRQGVTTDVIGEDTSAGPAKGKLPRARAEIDGRSVAWSTLGGYLDQLQSAGTSINIASHVGLGTVWRCVMGESLERPSPDQFEAMKRLIAEALDEGAFGLSCALAAGPTFNAKTDDLVALARPLVAHDGVFVSHIRNEGENVRESIAEVIAVGERAGVRVEVLHLKIADQKLWGRMNEIVGMIADARARGVNIQANVYPYTRGNNDLAAIIPPWAQEGGREAMLERLRSSKDREHIKADILHGLPGWYNHYLAVGGDWSRMLVSAKLSEPNRDSQGRTVDQILDAKKKARPTPSEPLDLFLDFLLEEGGSVGTIYAHHTEADMNLALIQPWASIGSDGSALAIEGVLRRGHPHPRNFGTFPRVLGVYCRQRGLLGIEEAIRKMTSQNATKLGLRDRGIVRPGEFADIVIFDPDHVIDRATYLDPFAYNEGIETVIVNGRVVLDQGRHTGAHPGRALRHGR